jgi:hypothetical protein
MNSAVQIIHDGIHTANKERNIHLSITPQSTLVYEGSNGHNVYLPKEDAIEVAKRILLKYHVPFANRVKNAGVSVE